MLDRAFLWWSVPLVGLLPLQHSKQGKRLLWIHLFLTLMLSSAYVYCRLRFGKNHPELGIIIKGRQRIFSRKGCQMLHFQPLSPASRRILLFPGLGISVTRMLQEPCMAPLLHTSEILCFQVRGIGDSDFMVDLSASTMLDDAIQAAYTLSVETNNELPTLFAGYSLGCFVSMQLLSNTWRIPLFKEPYRILLVNGMHTGDLVVSHFRIFSALLGISVAPHVAQSSVPITLLHAFDDKTIPYEEARSLKRHCEQVGREVELIPCHGTHSKYFFDDTVATRVSEL